MNNNGEMGKKKTSHRITHNKRTRSYLLARLKKMQISNLVHYLT
jgi:hypothetical protein